MPRLHCARALRSLWRDRTFSVVAAALLAVGIGSNTALFTLVDAVLLKPLPYPNADRLVALRIADPKFRDRYASFPANAAHLDAWRRHCRSCEAVAGIRTTTAMLTGIGETEQVEAARVTAGFFEVFGIIPTMGRPFSEADDRAGPGAVAIIGNQLWQRKFGGDPAVVGRPLTLDGELVTVVGILPASPRPPGPQQLGELVRLPRNIDVLRPAALTAGDVRSPGDLDYGVVARLRPGTSLEAVRSELDGLEPAVSQQTGDDGQKRAVVLPLADLVVGHARAPLLVLFCATAAVLLITCVNLANLLLARGASRQRDAAIRIALGAERRVLMREWLIESTLLATVGGVFGSLVALVCTRVLVRVAPPALPRLVTPGVDGSVLVFAALATIAAGLLVGLVPAMRLTRADPAASLRGGGYSTTDDGQALSAQRTLVGAQAAVSVALLVATGLLVSSVARILRVDRGFDAAGVLAADVALPPSAYADAAAQTRFLEAAIHRLRSLPGIRAAAVTSLLPLRGEASVNRLSYQNDTRPETARPLVNYRYVSPDYFTAMGTPILQGRTFRDADRGRQVVILSARTAAALWPGRDAVGRFVQTGGYFGATSEVIGVAADSRAIDLTRGDALLAYLPYWLRAPWTTAATLVVRTTVPPRSLAGAVRRAIGDVDPVAAIPRIETMEDIVGAAVADRRLELSVMAVFGCVALIVAALGIHGLVSCSVTRREREFGIRLALGASVAQVRRLVFEEGLRPVSAGIVAGLAVAVLLGQAMRSLLFDVVPADPTIMAAAAALVLLVTVGTCVLPARRTARAIVRLRR